MDDFERLVRDCIEGKKAIEELKRELVAKEAIVAKKILEKGWYDLLSVRWDRLRRMYQ